MITSIEKVCLSENGDASNSLFLSLTVTLGPELWLWDQKNPQTNLFCAKRGLRLHGDDEG